MSVEIDLRINSSSVFTGIEARDEHLRSADFFDAERFPEIRFNASSLAEVDGEGHFALYGELTMKGIKKQIKLDVEFGGVVKDPWGNEKAGFSINGKINRKDWALNWNAALEAGGFLVGDEVRISCEVQLLKSNEEPVSTEANQSTESINN